MGPARGAGIAAQPVLVADARFHARAFVAQERGAVVGELARPPILLELARAVLTAPLVARAVGQARLAQVATILGASVVFLAVQTAVAGLALVTGRTHCLGLTFVTGRRLHALALLASVRL